MSFASLLVFILFQFKIRSNISGIRVVDVPKRQIPSEDLVT